MGVHKSDTDKSQKFLAEQVAQHQFYPFLTQLRSDVIN